MRHHQAYVTGANQAFGALADARDRDDLDAVNLDVQARLDRARAQTAGLIVPA